MTQKRTTFTYSGATSCEVTAMLTGPVSSATYYFSQGGSNYYITRENSDGSIAWSKSTPNIGSSSVALNNAETTLYAYVSDPAYTYIPDTANTLPWDVKEQLTTQTFVDLKPQSQFDLAVDLTCSISGNLVLSVFLVTIS